MRLRGGVKAVTAQGRKGSLVVVSISGEAGLIGSRGRGHTSPEIRSVALDVSGLMAGIRNEHVIPCYPDGGEEVDVFSGTV